MKGEDLVDMANEFENTEVAELLKGYRTIFNENIVKRLAQYSNLDLIIEVLIDHLFIYQIEYENCYKINSSIMCAKGIS